MSISVTKLFGLEGERWMRHANPVSVWTRFAVLPLLALAVWSREWIGWWSLPAVALVLVFMMVNPLLFPPPRSTRHWASKGVFGERIWTDRDKAELPAQFLVERGGGNSSGLTIMNTSTRTTAASDHQPIHSRLQMARASSGRTANRVQTLTGLA